MKLNAQPLKLVVAAVVVAIAGTFALTVSAQPMGPGMHGGRAMQGPMMDGSGPGCGAGHRPGYGPGAGMHLSERMLDRVNATREQRAQIKQIMQSAAADLKTQREAGRALRDQRMQLFAQPTIDTAAVEAARQQLLAHHDAVSKRMTQAMLQASNVLTPEQRKQATEGMKQQRDMMQRHWQERRALEAPKS